MDEKRSPTRLFLPLKLYSPNILVPGRYRTRNDNENGRRSVSINNTRGK